MSRLCTPTRSFLLLLLPLASPAPSVARFGSLQRSWRAIRKPHSTKSLGYFRSHTHLRRSPTNLGRGQLNWETPKRCNDRNNHAVLAGIPDDDSDPLLELYRTLEVEPGASEKELKLAFRRMTLKYHPDVSNATGTEEKFQGIKLAYETLRIPAKREAYLKEHRRVHSTEIVRVNTPANDDTRRERPNEEEFYGFSNFFMDLVKDEIQRKKSGKSKTMWEELGSLGEEIVGDLLDMLEGDANNFSKDTKSADDIIRETPLYEKNPYRVKRKKDVAPTGKTSCEGESNRSYYQEYLQELEEKEKQETEKKRRRESEIDDELASLKRKLESSDGS